MFFGQKLTQDIPMLIQLPHKLQDNKFHLILTNLALSIQSQKSHIFIQDDERQILVVEFNRKANLLSKTLNLCLYPNSEKKIYLISKQGDAFVCGHFENQHRIDNISKVEKKHQNMINQENQTNRQVKANEPRNNNKKSSDQITKSTQLKQIITQHPQRRSSRLSNRPLAKQTVTQSCLKKQTKNQKKNDKKTQQSMLKNGRSSLASLLMNLEDEEDDDDQDEQFQSADQSSSDDSQDDQNGQESDGLQNDIDFKLKKKILKGREQKKGIQQLFKYNKNQDNLKIKVKNIQKAVSQKENNQILINTKQYEQKYPQNIEDRVPEFIRQEEEKIQQFAKMIKVPTKRPTI